MSFELTSDLLERQVIRRFDNDSDASIELSFNKDLYLDLLCIFNNPDSFKASDFIDYPLSSILLYLKKTHELYKTRSLQDIMMSIERLDNTDHVLAELQGSLNSFFRKFKADLEEHIQEEEEILFPYIESFLNPINNSRLRSPILTSFLNHHDDHLESELFSLVNALKNISDIYSDSFSFRMLMNRLTVFELDLKVHGKIEEEVLVPKALELEKSRLS